MVEIEKATICGSYLEDLKASSKISQQDVLDFFKRTIGDIFLKIETPKIRYIEFPDIFYRFFKKAQGENVEKHYAFIARALSRDNAPALIIWQPLSCEIFIAKECYVNVKRPSFFRKVEIECELGAQSEVIGKCVENGNQHNFAQRSKSSRLFEIRNGGLRATADQYFRSATWDGWRNSVLQDEEPVTLPPMWLVRNEIPKFTAPAGYPMRRICGDYDDF